VSVQGVHTSLKRQKSTGEIASELFSKYSLVTVVNWAKYQGQSEPASKQAADESTGNQQATNNIVWLMR
jgi:hypothetical protein